LADRRAGAGFSPLNDAKGVFIMFTRIVECYVKPEKIRDFNETMQNRVLPILQSQAGFVDLIALSSEDEPERMVALSIWKSRDDAERYHRAHYEEVVDTIRPLLKDEPSVEFYNLETSTAHRIMERAA
jgi:quinol monooxygenase YgiN